MTVTIGHEQNPPSSDDANRRASVDPQWRALLNSAPSVVDDVGRHTSNRNETPQGEERSRTSWRESVAANHFSPQSLLDYARFLIQQSSGSVAEEILALLIAQDGALIDALELYLELVTELELPESRATWALNRLSSDIERSQASHRGALDYAIRFNLTSALTIIGAGTDPVNQAIIRINNAYGDTKRESRALNEARNNLGSNDITRSLLTVYLGRGEYAKSAALLSTAETRAVPMNSLRRSIRAARARGADTAAQELLEVYLRIRPSDSWARSVREKYTVNPVSNKQIATFGYPFPESPGLSAYVPQPNTAFYLAHNSLPHHAAGYATRTHGLLTALHDTNWDVHAFTRLGYPSDLKEMKHQATNDDDTVGTVVYNRLRTQDGHTEPKYPLYNYTSRYAKEISERALKLKPALIHAASNHWNGLAGVHAAKSLGLPSIYEVRGLWEITRASREPRWAGSKQFSEIVSMETEAARGATRVLALTHALKEELVRRGVERRNISVLPNGVDTQRFRPIPRDPALEYRFNLNNKTVIGYVGTILEYEGIGLLLEAVRVLRATNSKFHVLIVGTGVDLEKYVDYARAHALTELVTFTGPVPHHEVERYYSLIDITPFPRLPLPVCELVSPLKPFEAMAMEKAVIASDVAALREAINPSKNGFLHEKGNAESLAGVIHALIESREAREEIGTNARKWSIENRDWSRISKILARTYDELSA